MSGAIKKPVREVRRDLLPPGECKGCDDIRARGETFAPYHDASPRCESGRHNHCSCDTCF